MTRNNGQGVTDVVQGIVQCGVTSTQSKKSVAPQANKKILDLIKNDADSETAKPSHASSILSTLLPSKSILSSYDRRPAVKRYKRLPFRTAFRMGKKTFFRKSKCRSFIFICMQEEARNKRVKWSNESPKTSKKF